MEWYDLHPATIVVCAGEAIAPVPHTSSQKQKAPPNGRAFCFTPVNMTVYCTVTVCFMFIARCSGQCTSYVPGLTLPKEIV